MATERLSIRGVAGTVEKVCDKMVRVWDLRRKVSAYVLPAHSSLISDVRWAPSTGEALATASFDGTVKLWAARDWSLRATLEAHDGKAMSVDFARCGAGDGDTLFTAGYDRTFKVWQPSGALEGYA